MNFLDPLKKYISNSFLRILIYAFIAIFAIPLFVININKQLPTETANDRVLEQKSESPTATSLEQNNVQDQKNNSNNETKQVQNESQNLVQNSTKFQDNNTNNATKPVQTETQNSILNKSQGFSEEGTKNSSKNSELFLVTKVIDGDTIEIEGGKRVRYIGIDTPETVHPSKPVECYGKEASSKNLDLVLNKKVKLVKDVSETDKYGRLLRYVYVGDIFVNDYLVKEGYAKASTYPPDVKFNEQFLTSQKYAIDSDKGLWGSACDISTTSQTTTTQVITQNLAPKTSSNTENESNSSDSSEDVVKKSSTGICHAPGTTYYSRTKKFTPYDSIKDCLDSGGRLPKR